MLQCSRPTSTKRLVHLANSHVGVCLLLCAIMAMFLWWNLESPSSPHLYSTKPCTLNFVSRIWCIGFSVHDHGVLVMEPWIPIFSTFVFHKTLHSQFCLYRLMYWVWCPLSFCLSLSFLEKKDQLFSDGWMASTGICDSKVGILSWKNSRKLAVGCDGLCAWMQ